jgi:Cro/C1-type HTH DNA-binding domain
MSRIQNKLKQVIEASGKTRYAWAKSSGISQKTIYNLYDDPLRVPDAKVLALLCDQGYEIQDVIEHVKS